MLLPPALAFTVLLTVAGCSTWTPWKVRSQSPEEKESKESKTRVIGDIAVPYGLFPVKVEGVGLVTGLRGTGSDPRPSPERARLLGEMQIRGVKNPESVLASPNTALVIVRGILPAGAQEGDRFDIEVRIPSHDETTSLRGGFLLETRLSETAVLGGQIHEGKAVAVAEGPLLVDPSASEDDKDTRVLLGRARILGGGVSHTKRSLLLALREKNVLNSAAIETAVNRRFHSFHNGIKIGMAKAKEDDYVELLIHPRYKDNIQRYVQVVLSTSLRENEVQQVERLKTLEKQLLDSATSSRASLQLESIGSRAVDVLKKGCESKDAEVRFYAAESLAYLDRNEAVEPLADAARNQPAFRVFALAALSAMDDYAAYEQLRGLLDGNSAETRYGAFRSLWAMNAEDPYIRGEVLGNQFGYHVLKTKGTPMIHVTRSHRPEIVLFGTDQHFTGQMALEAGNQIMVTSTKPGEVAIAKFAVGEADQKRVVSDRVDDVIRAIVELGGTYPDVVQVLQEAKAKGSLPSRFEVDAVPEAGRTYDRVAGSDGESATHKPASPLPELFSRTGGKGTDAYEEAEMAAEEAASKSADSAKKPGRAKAFFAKIMGRSSE
jgi:flagellar basal body P-ring protein FlgI